MKNKLNQLLEKQSQLKAQIQNEKSKEKKQQRKDDTRRKILIGAVVINNMKENEDFEKTINKLLDQNLDREKDRLLFSFLGKSTENGK